ncbi:DUF2306 domain-containing protein [Nonomuraea wenchangensis]
MTQASVPAGSARRRASRLVPVALIALSAVPLVAGALRLSALSGGPDVLPDGARFAAMPVPVVAHIIAATGYTVLGAFQFGGRRPPARHRLMGRFLLPLGLVVALSGIWMTLSYPRQDGGDLLAAFRLGFGSLMAAALVLGLAAVLRRRYARHRAWMIRAYALGLGAGSQALILGLWTGAAGGDPTGTTRALLLGAGWAVNLAVAEWLIRRSTATGVSA